MNRCPNCGTNLKRAAYEGLPVDHCHGCHGILVFDKRLDTIKRRPDTPQDVLQAQVDRSPPTASRRETRCPKCTKKMKTYSRYDFFEVEHEYCHPCQLVWLDPGEIAMLQLLYEATPAFKNNQLHRRAHAELESDAARLERYNENVKNLRTGTVDPVSAVLGGFVEWLSKVGRRAWWSALDD
ncbi:MAG: zf-TFIIB domain-containing protein [Planctomycetota bacterium]